MRERNTEVCLCVSDGGGAGPRGERPVPAAALQVHGGQRSASHLCNQGKQMSQNHLKPDVMRILLHWTFSNRTSNAQSNKKQKVY